MGNVSAISKESPLMYILDKWSDYSRELRTHECEEYILLKQCMATVPVRISERGLGTVILGPCAPNTATLAVLIMSFAVSCVIGICKTPRPNLRVCLGFSVVLWVLHFILFGAVSPFTTKLILWYLELFTDVKWKKVTTGRGVGVGREKSVEQS